MKKFFRTMIISIVFVISFANNSEASTKKMTLWINGKNLNLANPLPYINKDKKVMVPVRIIGQKLGYKVIWDGKTKQDILTKNNRKISVKAGNNNVLVNGKSQTIDTKMETKSGWFYVPTSFVTNILGEKASFNATTNEVKITTNPTSIVYGAFPLKKGTYSPFGDTWGASRTYGGNRHHEGTDIMSPKGTPIYAATSGTIVRIGWNTLGGWRISIQTTDNYNLYYAHMSKYATGMKLGTKIKQGQVIGYVGNTGYGPTGTSGKFATHLHFGVYDKNWVATNPYNFLKYWEKK